MAARGARAAGGRLPTIGFFGAGSAAAQAQWIAAFVQRLRELGWIEGRNVAIEYRWAEGRAERLDEIAAELVRLKVDVIVTHTPATVARQSRRHRRSRSFSRRRATRSAAGIVASWHDRAATSPGCRVKAPMLAGKRLELLREIVPGLRRVAVLANVEQSLCRAGDERGSGRRPARSASRSPRSKSGAAKISRPLSQALKGRAEALYVVGDPVVTNQPDSHQYAWRSAPDCRRCYGVREYVEAGGLISYGPNWPDHVPARWRLRR